MAADIGPTPRHEHRGYNRGLILGLTMAESMLLLVFCLLLVAAALVTAERTKRHDAEQRLRVVERQLAEAEKENAANARLLQLQSKMQTENLPAADRAVVDKEWRELVSARKVIDALADNGLAPKDLEKLPALAKVLRDRGIPLETAAEDMENLIAGRTSKADAHEWPPIINLSEAGGYFFQSGSAELTNAFRKKLGTSISDQIADNLSRYQVDVIEVIGHTDEQPVAHAASNLDRTFVDVLDGKQPISAVEPADNAGLGLARAIAVANILKANPKLKDATVLPMSAAQLILPGDTVTTGQAGNVEARRRIEIRIRRRAQSLTP